MDNLTYELRALCRRNRDGSHATQADRTAILMLVSHQLLESGFRRMQATSLKRKHVGALLERWLAERLSPGTIKNRMAALRWWAQKVGNAGAIPADVPLRRLTPEGFLRLTPLGAGTDGFFAAVLQRSEDG